MNKHTSETNNSNNFKQPEALHLADYLEFSHRRAEHSPEFVAASELRRLHEASVELLEALLALLPDAEANHLGGPDTFQRIEQARAAIAKATEGAV